MFVNQIQIPQHCALDIYWLVYAFILGKTSFWFFLKMHLKIQSENVSFNIWWSVVSCRPLIFIIMAISTDNQRKTFRKTHQILWIKKWKTFMFSKNTPLHLSWLIWETMVFTAHLIVNDMAFGLGNLRSMNLFSHITLGRSFSYTRIIVSWTQIRRQSPYILHSII